MSLKTDNLRVYYQTLRGEVKALDGMSIQIQDHEIIGLAGESGCGKTTFSNALTLLKPPMKYKQGTVLLDEVPLPIQDYEKMRALRFNKVSIIPQYAMNAMNPTVRIGAFIQRILQDKKIEYDTLKDEIHRRLNLVRLDPKVLKMFPIELSGGMKQRMVMVISTLLNPSLLIADEITSALDVSSQKAVAEMLVEFRNLKLVKSIIFVTHDVSILYQISDRILIMYAGKFVEMGPTEEVIHHPVHPYTKLLVSSMPDIGIQFTEKKLKGIPGQPPNLLNPAEGCRFRERCPIHANECAQEPAVRTVNTNHQIACWKAGG